MIVMLGDLGTTLLPFEVDLTVALKTGTTNLDGYIEENLATSVTFKGVILPMSTFTPTDLGTHDEKHSILYVRMSQENYPSLSNEDIVTDGNENEWKIIREADYEAVGEVKLFFVQKMV